MVLASWLLPSRLLAAARLVDAYAGVREFVNLRLSRLGRYRARVQDFVAVHLVALVDDQVVALLCRTRGLAQLCRRLV